MPLVRLVLPMQRISLMTFGVDLERLLVPAGIPIYGQATAITTSAQVLASDIAELGVVNVIDFLALLAQWGQVGAPCDFDGNGVDVNDFLEMLANWGPCPA